MQGKASNLSKTGFSVRHYLKACGFPNVSWMSLRPKENISSQESKRLKVLANQMARVFIIDDHPNTGATFLRLVEHLQVSGVPFHHINILAPGHPVRPNWNLPQLTEKGVTITRLEPDDFHKAKLLQPLTVEPLLNSYFEQSLDGVKLRILNNPQVDRINQRLEDARKLSFHVHIKRIFEVELQPTSPYSDSPLPIIKRIMAKSVGWGWLGYHAYLAGVRLDRFVPHVIGLRNGILFTEWLEGNNLSENIAQTFVSGRWSICFPEMPDCLPAYVAERATQLRLPEDPCFMRNKKKSFFPNRTIVDELVDFLGGIYDSRIIARLKARTLRGEVQRYAPSLPTLVDGQMKPDEWIESPSGTKKVDYEHYNFIRSALKTTDIASDLAAAVFEFNLSETAEQKLLDDYTKTSGDSSVTQRILVYKLIYAAHAMRLAAARAIGRVLQKDREAENQRYVFARNFLIQQMHSFCAIHLYGDMAFTQTTVNPELQMSPKAWLKRLFLLDLDGVFDRALFNNGSFPHTTVSGPKALALLKADGFSIVPTTGRSVELTCKFCHTYGLPGAIAEHGGVIVDLITGKEIVLISDEASKQLDRCREALQTLTGAFIDPGYRYSIRAYRFDQFRTIPLHGEEVKNLLSSIGCDQLIHITGSDETYILDKDTDKMTGVTALKQHLDEFDGLIAAIGDSILDLPMLTTAHYGYAPSNCSSKIREAATNNSKLRVMKQPYQQGLLAAVYDLLEQISGEEAEPSLRAAQQTDFTALLPLPLISPDQLVIGRLLEVAERTYLRQILVSLNWNIL